METCLKLHGKKTLICLAELKGQFSRKVDQVIFDFENFGRVPSSSSIEECMPALHIDVECQKVLFDSINKPSFGTWSLTMIGENFNSSFNVSKTMCGLLGS